MNKKKLQDFILIARTKTYATAEGKTKALLDGSVQYEYKDGDWFYRDIYFIGNGVFPGLETVYYKNKPVWSMSYYGNFNKMTEEQADTMLRKALMDNWKTTRLGSRVEKDYGEFRYLCDGNGSIDELSGTEEIYVDKKVVYFFYYAGGFIG